MRCIKAATALFLLVACGSPSTISSTTLPSTTSVAQSTTTTFQEGTLPAVLADDPRFATLLELLSKDAPSLLGYISDERCCRTLFAPTDAAFTALGAATIEELRNVEAGSGRSGLDLTLQHHVINGNWGADALRERELVGPGATDVGGHGGAISIEVDGDDIRADRALLIETDVEASNGVIHVIDEVMIPAELAEWADE